MKYATWKLNFTDPKYGTGPESIIADQGHRAEAAWVDGQVEAGGTILGYITGNVDATQLTLWEYTELTQEEALAFAQRINSEAFLLNSGYITTTA
jgi:hypothetical protein